MKRMIFIILSIFIPLSLSAQINQSLTAYYPFLGNANDASGNSNHGTVNGATLVEDRLGYANSAYSFDGINDYIVVTDTDFFDIPDDLPIRVGMSSTAEIIVE